VDPVLFSSGGLAGAERTQKGLPMGALFGERRPDLGLSAA